MSCEPWSEKLDAYLDGELASDDARALHEHLRGCHDCALEIAARIQQKRSVHAASQRFTPDAAFRARIRNSIAAHEPSWRSKGWLTFLSAATAVALLVAGAYFLTLQRERGQGRIVGELVDQHVETLASANPVDVVSTDRHTVKPWFEGKIPFTFNLPELAGSGFVLKGGRVSYLNQAPGAELLFGIRQHQISVFVFQERGLEDEPVKEGLRTALSFGMRTWSHNGLRYFVVGDASGEDLDKLSSLVKAAS